MQAYNEFIIPPLLIFLALAGFVLRHDSLLRSRFWVYTAISAVIGIAVGLAIALVLIMSTSIPYIHQHIHVPVLAVIGLAGAGAAALGDLLLLLGLLLTPQDRDDRFLHGLGIAFGTIGLTAFASGAAGYALMH